LLAETRSWTAAMSQAVIAEQSMTRSPLDLKAASTSTWQGLIERKEQSTGIFTVGMNTHFPLSHIATRQSDIPNHTTLLTSSSLRAEDYNPNAQLPGLFDA
jgi:hypothetical protein